MFLRATLLFYEEHVTRFSSGLVLGTCDKIFVRACPRKFCLLGNWIDFFNYSETVLSSLKLLENTEINLCLYLTIILFWIFASL